jgi:hypothetical protein
MSPYSGKSCPLVIISNLITQFLQSLIHLLYIVVKLCFPTGHGNDPFASGPDTFVVNDGDEPDGSETPVLPDVFNTLESEEFESPEQSAARDSSTNLSGTT